MGKNDAVRMHVIAVVLITNIEFGCG